MRFYTVFFLILLFSCSGDSSSNETTDVDVSEDLVLESTDPICPENHADSIIPIVYGMPSEELFQKEDSGLVYLYGCEVPEDPNEWWCKIHEIEF